MIHQYLDVMSEGISLSVPTDECLQELLNRLLRVEAKGSIIDVESNCVFIIPRCVQ